MFDIQIIVEVFKNVFKASWFIFTKLRSINIRKEKFFYGILNEYE